MDTRSKTSSPLVNSLVKNRLFKTAPDMSRRFIIHPHYGFVSRSHEAVWQLISVRLLHMRKPHDFTYSKNRHCKQVHTEWRQYNVILTLWSIIEEDSKIYHRNFLLCNNNEITACIVDLFNSYCEELYVVAFFQGNAAANCRWSDKFN